jgi:trans-aconitate methyltransferase
MKWNSDLYDDKHNFVSKYGEDLVQLLAPKEGERILDLGCGTGDLTDVIKKQGADVIGLDSSKEMIATARKKYPGIQFDQGTAEDFNYGLSFDAIFSNATLHWVLEIEKAVGCMHRALKKGGRLVAEFGGKGNVAAIENALRNALEKNGCSSKANKQVWYFPSLSQYASLLEQNGFRVVFASHFDRPTLLKDDNGIRNWIQMFGQAYLQDIAGDILETILNDVEARIRPTNFLDGKWYADYVRLRIVALKL